MIFPGSCTARPGRHRPSAVDRPASRPVTRSAWVSSTPPAWDTIPVPSADTVIFGRRLAVSLHLESAFRTGRTGLSTSPILPAQRHFSCLNDQARAASRRKAEASVLGQVRAPGPPILLAQQGRHHRPGQPLARRHPWPAATGAARTKTFLGLPPPADRKRRGKKRALVPVGNSLLTIIWHLPSHPAHFTDLRAPTGMTDWPQRAASQLIAEIERLSGKKVTLHDAA